MAVLIYLYMYYDRIVSLLFTFLWAHSQFYYTTTEVYNCTHLIIFLILKYEFAQAWVVVLPTVTKNLFNILQRHTT